MSRTHLLGAAATLVALVAGAAPPAPSCPITTEPRTIRGSSMAGILEPAQEIIADFGWYACHPLERGELVLLSLPGRKDPLVKQAWVIPGDTFALRETPRGNELLVNGTALATPNGSTYAFQGKARDMLALYVRSFQGLMPKDTCFVFGTSSTGTWDSTRFGPVTQSQLLARVRSPAQPRPAPAPVTKNPPTPRRASTRGG